MLSYVVPSSKETSNANSGNGVPPSRSVNLNLSPQVTSLPSLKPNMQNDPAMQNVDAMLGNAESADSYNECTRLIDVGVPQPDLQNSKHKSNSLTNNNVGDIVSEEVENLNMPILDSNAIDKQTSRDPQKKSKLVKVGSKGVGLKRVSFGSSKGSMVETLVFETPTPLSEHTEPSFGFEDENKAHISTNHSIYSKLNMDDSGIEVQEESERSIVRVSIYQSSQPQQIFAPSNLSNFDDNLDNYNLEIMTTVSTIPGYDRQQSTDSGWDNPFRPGGDLSREADEIVNMIRGGKPITPIDEHSLENGSAQKEDNCNGKKPVDIVIKTNVTQSQSAQNGTNSHKVQSSSNPTESGLTSLAQVSKQVVPGPTSASHVVIDEKKSKKKGCCIIQ